MKSGGYHREISQPETRNRGKWFCHGIGDRIYHLAITKNQTSGKYNTRVATSVSSATAYVFPRRTPSLPSRGGAGLFHLTAARWAIVVTPYAIIRPGRGRLIPEGGSPEDGGFRGVRDAVNGRSRAGKRTLEITQIMPDIAETSSRDETSVSKKHPELFHYTSLKAFENILKTNTLWATHPYHLNDSSEMKLLWPIVGNQLISYLKEHLIFYLEQFPEHRQEIEELGGVESVVEHDGTASVDELRSLLFGNRSASGMGIPFVTSFTTHSGEDDQDRYHDRNGMLSQWRGYGCGDSVAIVFDSKKLEDLLRGECSKFGYLYCGILDVVYLQEESNWPESLPELNDALKDYAMTFLDPSDQKGPLEEFAEHLMPAVARLKHHAFQEEKECRVVTWALNEKFRYATDPFEGKKLQFKKICHRFGRSGSIPYIKLFENTDELLPISRILIGPSINQAAIKEKLNEFLCLFADGRDTIVQMSEIPYVGSTGTRAD